MFVYADNAATTCVSKAALDAMLPYLTEQYGNPSSLYSFGQKAKEALGDLAESEEDIMSYICFPAQAEKFLKDRKANREKVVKYTIEEA